MPLCGGCFFGGITLRVTAESKTRLSTLVSSTSMSVTQETLCHRQMVGITHLWKNLPLQVLTTITTRNRLDNRMQQSMVLTFKPLMNFSCSIDGLSSTDLLQLSVNESSKALIYFVVWPLLIDSLDVGCTVVIWINGTTGMEE